MIFKRFLASVLSNRFTRLLALVLLYAIIFVPALVAVIATDETSILFAPTIIFAICLIGQFFGDIMNVEGLFNNLFVTLLKRVIFFAAVLIITVFGAAFVISDDSWNIMMQQNPTFIMVAMNVATNFAAPFTLCAYVFFYVKHSKSCHNADNKKWLPFFLPITYVASVVMGIIMALILMGTGIDGGGASLVLGLTDAALALIAIIVSIKAEAWVFEEEAVVYGTSPSRPSSSRTPTKSEYERFREKCSNCVHLRSCRITENTTWGDKRNVDYCNLTGNEIYSIYSEVCPRFVDRYK